MTFEAWLTAKGITAESLDSGTRVALEGMWRKDQQEETAATTSSSVSQTANSNSANPDYEAIKAQAAAESARKAGLTQLAAKYLIHNKALQPIFDIAMADGKTTDQDLELTLYRQSMPAGPSFHIPSKPQVNQEVMEVAFARASGGLPAASLEKLYDDRTLSAADSTFRNGLGLKQLLCMGAEAAGCGRLHLNNSMEVEQALRAAFQRQPQQHGISAGPSTMNVSGILSNVGHKSSVDAFNAIPAHWQKISAIKPVTDLKEYSSFALTGDMKFKPFGDGGKIKHGTLDEEAYGNRADMQAIMLVLTYKQIRNDDTNAFGKINRMLGRGGAQSLNKEFWTEFLNVNVGSSSTVFWEAGVNYRANTDVAFGLAGLKVAHALVAAQTDPKGEPLETDAKFLIVPRGFALEADEHMSSTLLGRDDAGGTRNVLAGKWEVISPPQLDNANYPGSSPDNYYLLRDPADLPVIEVALLDGAAQPVIESTDADFDTLGIKHRGWWGYGVRKQEQRGGYKFKPTAD